MKSNNMVVKVGDLIDTVSNTYKFDKEYVVFLNTSDILEGKVINHNRMKIEDLPGQAKKSIQKGDILLSEIRPENKRFAFVDFDADEYVVSTKLMVLRSKNSRLNPKYFYYYITSNEKLMELQNIAEHRSGTFPQITFDNLKDMEINLPDSITQMKIVNAIRLYDDKIELNNKMNRTLEQIAQAIFKHWFIDFEFPCLPDNYPLSGAREPEKMKSVCTYKSVGGLPIPDKNKYFTYVLLCANGSFYIGITDDLYRRWYEHKTGQGAKWTKANEPVKVIHYEEFNSRSKAAEREQWLKTGFGRKWLKREYEKFLKSDGGSPAPESLHAHEVQACKLRQAGKMVNSELGKIPEGWKVGNFGECFTLKMGLSPKGESYNNDGQGIPLLNGAADFDNFLIKPTKYTTQPTRLNAIGDLIFCIRGTIGNIVFANSEYCLGRGVAALSPHTNRKYYNYFTLNKIMEELKSQASGSVIIGLSKDDINNKSVILPTEESLFNAFEDIMIPIFNRIFLNSQQNQTLSRLRDSLLPRLMSGKIKGG